jgi:hypothetical protein
MIIRNAASGTIAPRRFMRWVRKNLMSFHSLGRSLSLNYEVYCEPNLYRFITTSKSDSKSVLGKKYELAHRTDQTGTAA